MQLVGPGFSREVLDVQDQAGFCAFRTEKKGFQRFRPSAGKALENEAGRFGREPLPVTTPVEHSPEPVLLDVLFGVYVRAEGCEGLEVIDMEPKPKFGVEVGKGLGQAVHKPYIPIIVDDLAQDVDCHEFMVS